MVRQEEWGSARWQTRGRGEGGIQSVRQGTTARGPAGRSGGGAWAAAAVGSAHKNSNLFDLFKGISKRSDLIRLKDGLSELKNFQIKYGCERIKIRNNFPYSNFLKFGIEFELKFREGSRCLNSNKI
jgi:hypothetical protein